MPKFVTTARGVSLNIEKLIMDSKRPLNYQEPAGDINPVEAPPKTAAINMRGFMPAQSTAPIPGPAPEAPKLDVDVEVIDPTKFHRPDDTRSMADLTMVKVNQAKSIKLKPGAVPAPGDGAGMAEDTANRIVGQLKANSKGKKTVLDDLDE